MSDKFDMVKDYYDRKLWNLQRVWNVVGKAITGEEYQIITGFEYPNME